MRFKKTVAALAVSGALATGAMTAAAPADATERNGKCESGELCLYYYNYEGGPVFDMYFDLDNFAGHNFPGTNRPVNDDTESFRNKDIGAWYVFTNAYQTGAHTCLQPGAVGNFTLTFWNTISSATFGGYRC